MQTYNAEGMGDATDLVVGRLKNKSYYHLTIMARNRTGWHNLIRIHNESQKTKRGKHPLIDYDLLKQYGEGLIVLTGCLASPVAGSAAQTGVVAQLVVDELNLFDTLPQDVSEEDIADLEDLIFDAIASADTGVAKDLVVELEQVIQDIGAEALAADYTDAAHRLSRLRSNFPQLLGYDATVSIQNAVEPLTNKHDTIDAKGVQYAGLTGTHFTTDSVEAIIAAYDDAAEVAKQHKVKGQRLTEQNVKDTLREVLFGIIEQHYVRLFDRGLSPALAESITTRVEETSQLLNDAYNATQRLIDCVGKDHVFVEIMDHGITSETYAMDHLIPLAEHFDLDLVVTNDSHYIHQDDAQAHDAFLAVGTRSSLDTPGRFSFNGDNYHLMTEVEIRAIHPDDEVWQQAVTNTGKVAELVAEDTVPKPETRLPKFDLPEDFDNADDYLRHLVEDLAPERYGDDWREDEEVVERMNHELSVISDMGFSDYFLITWDIMDFCAREGITTGAGRGSAAGSLVSYVLGIVHVCPLDNGLLFERFLERGRVGLPDIDLDFPKFQRWRIHRYVEEKYGHDHVAQIGSFQSAKSRAAIRDAARVLTPDKDLAKTQQEQDRRREIFRLGDTLAKTLETQGADPLSFAELDALDENHSQKIEFFKAVEEAGDIGRQIVELARQMENISKGVSIHPCGFVISTEPLTDMVPLRPAANEGEPDVIIWDGDMCEDMGLLKMDFLAIQNLDYMDRTFEYLAEQDVEMSVFDIPDPNDDDETVDKTYELLREGRTAGLFQLDSDGMTRVLRDVAPNDLNDLSAVVALYRPGPLSAGMPEDYAAKKNGQREESYDHLTKDATEIEWLDTVLGETYQAALYQEQAMTLGRVIAGFDDKQRSTLRRAIGRKSRDLMREAQNWWFEGAQQEFKDDQGKVYSPVFSKDTAQRVWDFIEGAAEYSFNKCVTGDTVVRTADSTGRTIEELYRRIHASGATEDGLCPACLLRPARPTYCDQVCNPCASWRTKLNDNRGFTLLALDETDGRIRPQRMKTIHYNGERTVYELTFSDGSTIRATDNHRFRMVDGYRRVDEISIGDTIISHAGNDSYENQLDALRTTAGPRRQIVGNKPWLPGELNSGYVDGGFIKLREWTEATLEDATCDECRATRDEKLLERAHLDGDRRNNEPENLAWKCASHHKMWDYRHNGRIKRWGKGHLAGTLEVVGIREAGIEPVYDVEMAEGTDHNFVANGVISHNSHSAAYGQVAFWTAWLKANHPVEYSAAMLAVSDNEAKRLLVIKDLISEGIPIQAPSVNTSQTGSAPVGGEVHLGLAEIRNVGKAANAIVEEREKNGPFTSLHDLASRAKGLNTLALRALIESGACDEFGTRRGLLKNLVTAKVLDLPVDGTEFGVVERDARQRAAIGTVVGSNTLDSIDLDDLADRLDERDGDFTLDIDRLDDLLDTDHSVCHLGVVSGYDPFVSRSGLMAKAELSDGESLPVVIFNNAHRDMVKRYGEPAIGSLMVVSGQVKANTWTDDEGDEHSVLEILASRVWLPEDPTKVVEQPLATSMLHDALDGTETPADDDESEPDSEPVVEHTDGHDKSDSSTDYDEEGDGDARDNYQDPEPDPQRRRVTPVPVDHDGTEDNPDRWAGYVVVHMQRGRIDRTTGRVKGHLGSPRSVLLMEEHSEELVVLPDYKAVLVKYSGDLEYDMLLLEEKTPL
ncbi:MAG: DNA polymerase III subunit alpha [Yaniella sp.]|nr:DNA polymerase III subunit alpha [Yaniella sp.]